MVVPSGAASRTPAGTGTHLLKRVHEALRWSGRGTSCRATVITRTASGWAAAGDVTVAAGEEECCADIAARAALYGAPEDTLRQFAAALRLSSHAAQHRGKPPGLRCTFPFRVADRVAAYCDAGALASILRVNSHVFDNRDELVYGTLCRLAFPRASPAPPFCAAAAQAPAQSCSSVDEYVSPTSVSHRWLDTLRTARKAKPAGAIHVENATIVVSGVFRASAAGTAVYAARGSTICGARDVLLWEAGQDGELIVLLSFARAPAAAAEQARLMAAVHAAVVAEDAAASARPQARLPAAGKQPAAKPSNHFRVAVIGPGNVGKSAISVRYVQDTYVDNYDPNICDTYKKQDRVDATVCFLEIVDMAGQEEYASLRAQYYQRSDGFLAVFSIDDANSVDELLSEYRDLLRERSGEHPPIVLIANKCDLTSNDQAERLVSLTSEFGNAPFMRTSAKEMVNIPAAFHQLVREIRSSRDGVAADRPSPVESALASNHFVSTPRSSASEDLDLEFPSTLSSTSTCTERPAIFPSTDLSDRSSPAPAPHPKPRTRPARHEPQQHLPKRRKKPKRKCVVM